VFPAVSEQYVLESVDSGLLVLRFWKSQVGFLLENIQDVGIRRGCERGRVQEAEAGECSQYGWLVKTAREGRIVEHFPKQVFGNDIHVVRRPLAESI
jgi:hypothetical protein